MARGTIPILRVGGNLLATVHVELRDAVAEAFQEDILTGISAQVARTIIQLGVDISSMDTQSRLSDGIELALSLIGKAITAKGA